MPVFHIMWIFVVIASTYSLSLSHLIYFPVIEASGSVGFFAVLLTVMMLPLFIQRAFSIGFWKCPE